MRSATVSNSILASGVVVGEGADVTNCIITAGKSVAAKGLSFSPVDLVGKIVSTVLESDDEMDMD